MAPGWGIRVNIDLRFLPQLNHYQRLQQHKIPSFEGYRDLGTWDFWSKLRIYTYQVLQRLWIGTKITKIHTLGAKNQEFQDCLVKSERTNSEINACYI